MFPSFVPLADAYLFYAGWLIHVCIFSSSFVIPSIRLSNGSLNSLEPHVCDLSVLVGIHKDDFLLACLGPSIFSEHISSLVFEQFRLSWGLK